MKNKIVLIVLVSLTLLAIILGGVVSCQQEKIKTLTNDNARLDWNVGAGLSQLETYKSTNNLLVAKNKVLTMTVDEFEKYGRKEDRDLIKELKLKPKDVEQIVRTNTVTRDSLIFVPKENGCFDHVSKWLEVHSCKNEKDSFLIIESRDSVAQVLVPIYKWKFLWMRGKVIGIDQHMINYNPNSRIKYSSTIMLKK